GIPLPALQQGLSWDWKSFADYLQRVEDHGTAVNAGFLAGHSAVRRVVMGEAAVGQEATDDQIEQMERLLHECLDAGAMGFSTSQAHTHNDGDGNPVPSRAATRDELVRLAGAVRSHPGTQLELIIAGCLNGFSDDDVDLMTAMSLAADRPVNWNVLGVTAGGMHEHQLEAGTRAAERGARVVALTLPKGVQIRLSFLSGFVLDGLPGWREIIALPVPERIKAFSDPAVRARLDRRGGASYSTFVVGDAVRNGYLPLEEAVRLLTDKPARLYGLRDRGRVAEGAFADLVCFDPATIGPLGERTYDDLPGGASRI